MADESEHVATVRRVFSSFRTDGVEAGLTGVHPEFEMTTPSELASEPGTYRGHDGIRAWFNSFDDAMDRIQIVPSELRDAGPNYVASGFSLSARGRTSGLEFKQVAGMLMTMRDAKLAKIEYFANIDEAMAEAEARSR